MLSLKYQALAAAKHNKPLRGEMHEAFISDEDKNNRRIANKICREIYAVHIAINRP